ncbi:alpha/beta hydrolase [Spirosoma sordidisoli]|uniref:Alpha/beta hydrolase n=2 Tax=Spirosoma sordidisoli TaxID=2502893 RepID=A0A4Q2UP25_9BACT|nr:alpha/beta hydrolase [Spirosoma sordidisoli]
MGSSRFRWRMLLLILFLLIALIPRFVSVRMSDPNVADHFASRPVKPTFAMIQAVPGNGTRPVHYARIGRDTLPTVLFIHGSPGSWDAFISFFADSSLYTRAQLISADRPGFGKSGLGKPERSLAVQAASLAPLLRLSRSVRKPILVGHSLGGPVAARMAMDYPNDVGGLILVAPSIDPDLEEKEWYRPIGTVFPFRQWLPTELDVSNQEILPLRGELETMRPRWATIRVPVTVIQGEDAPLVPAGNAAFAQRMLVNAPVTMQLIPKMNHFIPWSRPDLIHDAILDQLTSGQSTHVSTK